MSTFCVFGIRKDLCIAQARKIIPVSIKGKSLSIELHSKYANMLAEYIFNGDESKASQISAAFDAPQFALDWIALAEKTNSARRMKIMVKADKKDKNGEFIIKKGARIKTWEEYKC